MELIPVKASLPIKNIRKVRRNADVVLLTKTIVDVGNQLYVKHKGELINVLPSSLSPRGEMLMYSSPLNLRYEAYSPCVCPKGTYHSKEWLSVKPDQVVKGIICKSNRDLSYFEIKDYCDE